MPDHPAPAQVLASLRRVIYCALALLLLLPLTGCGKKPAKVDPPPGVEDNVFPKTYPDPATDPKP